VRITGSGKRMLPSKLTTAEYRGNNKTKKAA